MLMLTTMNDNDIASKFKATIHILFIYSQIIVLILRIQSNGKDPLFGIALLFIDAYSQELYIRPGSQSSGQPLISNCYFILLSLEC